MSIHDIIYDNTDDEYHAICDFLDRLSTEDPFLQWESGRMNYWRYNVHAQKEPHDRFFRDNVHVWRTDNQEIIGLCISEYGRNDLFIEVLPAYHFIYPDIFRWIETTWTATRTAIEVDIVHGDRQKIDRLKARDSPFCVILRTSGPTI